MSPKSSPGDRFDRLQLISLAEKEPHGTARWTCRCHCGKIVEVGQHELRNRKTRSCGCLQREVSRTHGHASGGRQTPIYQAWRNMIKRCTCPNNVGFAYYGGRGITVCKRWRNNFEVFLADMGEPPKGMTLDRKNNNLGYFPANCRWTTPKEQSRNRRNNRLLTWNGRTQCLIDWAKEVRLPLTCLFMRLSYGWSVDKALSTTKRMRSKNKL